MIVKYTAIFFIPRDKNLPSIRCRRMLLPQNVIVELQTLKMMNMRREEVDFVFLKIVFLGYVTKFMCLTCGCGVTC